MIAKLACNKNQQTDAMNLSFFVQKDAQKLPNTLRSCGWRYTLKEN